VKDDAAQTRDEANDRDDADEPSSQRDLRLVQLANQLADELREGKLPNVDAVIRDNADLADDLRGLWATMLVTDCVAAGAAEHSAAGRWRRAAVGIRRL
jgi:hypothetical protein